MYRCERCQQLSAPGAPAQRVVVETRRHQHPRRAYLRRGDRQETVDPGGVGPQIVRELLLCASCADELRRG